MYFNLIWNLTLSYLDEEKAKLDPSYYLKNTNTETRETLLELYKEFKGDEILAATMKAPEKKKVDKLNAVSWCNLYFGTSIVLEERILQDKQIPSLVFSVTWKFIIVENMKIILRFHRNTLCVSVNFFVDSLWMNLNTLEIEQGGGIFLMWSWHMCWENLFFPVCNLLLWICLSLLPAVTGRRNTP